MPNYNGLYYPFINFKDEAWLKFTALYWDKMGRIVPKSYGPTNDSPAVEKFVKESDFIENVEPQKEASDVGSTFLKLISGHGEKLRDLYDVNKSNTWVDDPITKIMAPSGSNPKFAYVYYEQLSDELRKVLLSNHLSSIHHGRGETWVGMHPQLASVYMIALAEEIASNQGYHPVTDETFNHLAVSGYTGERLAQALLKKDANDANIVSTELTTDEIEAQLVRLTLQSVIPEDIENVPTEKIIKVREDHKGELANFQKHISNLVTDLGKMEIKDTQYLTPHLEQAYNKNIKPELENLKAILHSAGMKSTVGAMNISMGSSFLATLGHYFIPDPAGAILAGASGIALGLTSVYLDKRKATQEAMQKSPAAYLLRLEKELQPSGLISWIIEDSKKFFFRQ